MAPLCAPGERCAEQLHSAAASPEGALESLSDAVYETPTFVAGLDDVTVMGETVK